MKISIIIPTLNESKNLVELLPMLWEYGGNSIQEIIVSDAGSTDATISIAKDFGAILVHSKKKSRAHQINFGIKEAKGAIFYIVHADCRPAINFSEDIIKNCFLGKEAGCYRYSFDSNNFLLKINSWFTRFNGIFAGGGDQTLYITRNLFERLGGFDEKFTIMEDFDLTRRIKKISDFHVIPKEIKVSARKYEGNGWLKVQLANLIAFTLFLLKISPDSIKSLYCTLLKQQKTS
ncbi:TIGR04283 family arsenosugar biosynthesis glycosyltransferase [Algoriphagus aestuarii]|nr:TIGR04283 family arsenosugar biosynthesis glycosyltransferase [Algoriphagus aestuarii]